MTSPAGWAARLDVAVRAASNRFVGPLASPREPWHYTFSPEAVAAQYAVFVDHRP